MMTYIKNCERVCELIKSLDDDDLKRIEMDDKSGSYFNDMGLDVYLVENDDIEIGFFGIHNVEAGYCQTPLFIKKEHRSKGYGKEMVRMAEKESARLGFHSFVHRIKTDNENMMRLSKSCGYSLSSVKDGYFIMFNERGL